MEFLEKLEMFRNMDNADMVFRINNKDLPAHKAIVCAASPTLNKLLNGCYALQGTDIIKIVLKVKENNMLPVIRYMYIKSVKLNPRCALPVMHIASYLELTELEEICCEYLSTKLTVTNVTKIYESCFILDNNLTKRCLEFIKDHFEDILHESSIMGIDFNALKPILKMDDLYLGQECLLFEAMCTWAKNVCKAQGIIATITNQKKLLQNHLKYVRFATMPITDFVGKCILKPNNYFNTIEAVDFFCRKTVREQRRTQITVSEPKILYGLYLTFTNIKFSQEDSNTETYSFMVTRPIEIYAFEGYKLEGAQILDSNRKPYKTILHKHNRLRNCVPIIVMKSVPFEFTVVLKEEDEKNIKNPYQIGLSKCRRLKRVFIKYHNMSK